MSEVEHDIAQRLEITTPVARSHRGEADLEKVHAPRFALFTHETQRRDGVIEDVNLAVSLLTVCVDVRREGTLSETRRKPSRLTEKRVRDRPRLFRLSDAIKRVESTVELVHAGTIEQKVS